MHEVQPQEGIGVYHEDVEARTRGSGSVSWLRLWVLLSPPLIVWTDGSSFSTQRSQYVWQNARPWGCHMRRLRRREILQGVALASPDSRESIVVEYMQKKREHQTLVVSHTDGSDKCDRSFFWLVPLLCTPRAPQEPWFDV